MLIIVSAHHIYGMVESGSRSPGLLLHVILSLVVSGPVLIVFSVRCFHSMREVSKFVKDSRKIQDFSEENLEVARDDGLLTMPRELLLACLSILALPSMTMLLTKNLSRFRFGLQNPWKVFETGFLAYTFPLIVVSLILVFAILVFRRPLQD